MCTRATCVCCSAVEAWCWRLPQTHFTKALWDKNSSYFYTKNVSPIRSLFCTCHDSRVAVTFAELWPDWIIRMKIRKNSIFIDFSSVVIVVEYMTLSNAFLSSAFPKEYMGDYKIISLTVRLSWFCGCCNCTTVWPICSMSCSMGLAWPFVHTATSQPLEWFIPFEVYGSFLGSRCAATWPLACANLCLVAPFTNMV